MCNALEACQPSRTIGGHMYAAGMTIKPENLLFKEVEKQVKIPFRKLRS
jgi:hypothetical protein